MQIVQPSRTGSADVYLSETPATRFLLIGMGAGFAELFIVCIVAYLFNMDKSIYALQEQA